MPASRRSLPERPNLEQQKKLAKELLAAFRRGDAEARDRIRAELPDKARISLGDAQFVLAREYGFTNWRALAKHIDALAAPALPLLDRFKQAVRDRDAGALRALTAERAALSEIVNEPLFAFDAPALAAVAGDGRLDLVDSLLDLGADPNARSRWWAGGFHPLHIASGDVADRLIAAGAIPDACAAAQLDRADLLADMLAADPSRAMERGGDGQTPLHFARSRRVADLLLAAGADIDARDVDHRSTPAEWMLGDWSDPRKSRIALARYLVERGASVDIFLAAAIGDSERVRAIVQRDPAVLRRRTGQGEYAEQPPSSYHIYLWTIGPNMTPLQAASHFQQQETLNVMRSFAPPEQQLLLACHDGDAAAARAIVHTHPGIVEHLGADDRRALTDEAWRANAPAVELMLELGFDPSATSTTGAAGGTALHCAAWEGSVDCVAALLRYSSGRALVDVRDARFGGTPLGWCCHGSLNCGDRRANHVEVARMLLEVGGATDDAVGGSEEVKAVIRAWLEASTSRDRRGNDN